MPELTQHLIEVFEQISKLKDACLTTTKLDISVNFSYSCSSEQVCFITFNWSIACLGGGGVETCRRIKERRVQSDGESCCGREQQKDYIETQHR